MNKIRKCLFPAAGYDTRFLPATKATPKEMFRYLPGLSFSMVQKRHWKQITTMAIVTGRGKRAIEDHFDISYELEHQIKGTNKEHYLTEIRAVIEQCTFTYTHQIEMKGLGHAILSGETLIDDEPFAVILADDLCDNNSLSHNTESDTEPEESTHYPLPATHSKKGILSQLVEVYEKYRCSVVAIEEVPLNETHKYGVIAGFPLDGRDDIYHVTDMVEKPSPEDAPSNMAIIGRYILTPDIFDILRKVEPGKGGEIQITDALLRQAKEGRVIAYKFEGRRFDCGSIDGFVEATNYFYAKGKMWEKLPKKQKNS